MKLYVAPSFRANGREPWHIKGYSAHSFRKPADVTAIVCHQLDVRGGFGAPSLEARAIRYGGTSMAKRGTAYHYVLSPKDDAVIAVRHPRVLTWHGDRSNSYSIGLGVDGSYPGDPVDPEQIAEGFRLAVEHIREQGFGPSWIEAHRQHSAGRLRDPGAELWRPLELAALKLSIFARPQHVTKSKKWGLGSPIPAEWRPADVLDLEEKVA